MKKIGYLLVYVFYFFLFRWIYMDFLYLHTLSVFPFAGEDFLLVFSINIIAAFFLTYISIALWTKKLHKPVIYIFASIYMLFLIYLLFFKSIGVRGYDLNPLSFLIDIYNGDSFIPFMNILFLIPLGCLCSTKKKMRLAMVCLFSAEVIQYIFYLGFFDLGDLLANYIGLMIGKMLADKAIHYFDIH